MHPRIQEYMTLTAGHIDMLKVIEEKAKLYLLQDQWASQVIAITKLQTTVLKAQMQAIPKTDAFIYSENEMINELQKLTHLLEKWEIAEKETRGQGVGAFLDLAEPIGSVIKKAFVPLQTKLKEKREGNKLIYPSINELLEIKTQIGMIDPLIQTLSSDAPEDYYGVVGCLKAFQIGTLEVVNKRIELTKSINTLLAAPSKVVPLFIKYQALVTKEEEEDDEAEQQAALDEFVENAKILRAEGQNLAVLDSLNNEAANSPSMPIQAPSFHMPSISDSPQSLSVKAPSTPPSSDDEAGFSSASEGLHEFSLSGGSESKSHSVPTTPKSSISASATSQSMFKSAQQQAQARQPQVASSGAVTASTTASTSSVAASPATAKVEKKGFSISNIFNKKPATPAQASSPVSPSQQGMSSKIVSPLGR